jgi:hypothetical protein
MQNSFFVHFNLFGAIPNIVFILFFVLVFFSRQGRDPAVSGEIIFYAISAGLFLDFFSYTYFGVSIFLLMFFGVATKKIQSMLQEKVNDKFPFVYFLPFFLGSLIIYNLLLNVFSVTGIIINSLIACIFFYIYNKFFVSGIDDRQLKLIK